MEATTFEPRVRTASRSGAEATMKTASLALFLLCVELTGCSSMPRTDLPDWSRIWEVDGLVTGASGVIETPVPDIIREFGASPPFSPEGRARHEALVRQIMPHVMSEAHRIC